MNKAPIFKSYAPTYWNSGYSVIPVRPATKQPTLPGWTGYCDNFPSEKTQKDWLQHHGECGIGLLLGGKVGGFRIAAIDIDRDELVASVSSLIKSPSGKIGKKGVTLFVRVPTEEPLKSGIIPGINGSAGDLLFGAKMTVLPPSLHPDTGEPYKWVGLSLLETSAENLPILDTRLYGVLIRMCTSAHIAAIQSGVGTHTPTLSLVAELVSAKATDVEIMAVVAAAFPEGYSGNTLDELAEMVRSAREKGFGDPAIEEGDDENIAGKLVKLCLRNDIELFHDGNAAYASIPTQQGGCLTYRTNSEDFKGQVRHAWYKATRKSVGSNSLGDAIATLGAIAQFEGPDISVWNRVGKEGNDVLIDLCRDDGQVVRINKDGWNTDYQKETKFCRVGGAQELPVPAPDGDLQSLQTLLHLSEEQFLAVIAFLISSLSPVGPYFVLLIEGAQGSGKSFLAWVIKMLIDPNAADRLRLPDNERDLAIHAKQFRLLSYDNTSGMKAGISDALCIIATGGGIATRKLYTDEELAVIAAARPTILNGISGFVKRPDLLERSIYLSLDTMPVEKRRTEEEMKGEFMAKRSAILAGLYDLISHALANLEKTAAPIGVRMADAARFIAAAEGGLGVDPGALIRIISGSQDALMIERINEEPLTLALRHVLRSGPFEGTVGQLFERFSCLREIANLPRSTAQLSTTIERLKPSLIKVGIRAEMLSRSSAGKKVRIDYTDPDADVSHYPRESELY